MAKTVLGNSIVVDGEISGDEALVVHGSIKGNVKLGERFEVEPGAIVEATVEATTVVVSGTVSGDVRASERVELRPECNVVGDLRAPRVLIADGATFRGRVDMGG
ncbi:MAG: polymer-forming cytoskeletal protein [Myxococcales bacterium]|nr:polymer-forming cytoskeletal protein [Myxococcales bacterium]MCB9749953.1 polymer-forming cytoskeletal protein [Myxococcales bacterium]